MTKVDELYDRYQHDAVFRQYVDMFRKAIVELHLGPGEVRDVAMLASYIEIMRSPVDTVLLEALHTSPLRGEKGRGGG